MRQEISDSQSLISHSPFRAEATAAACTEAEHPTLTGPSPEAEATEGAWNHHSDHQWKEE